MEISIRSGRREDAPILTDLSMRSKQSNGYDDAFMEACREELTVTGDMLSKYDYWIAEAGGNVCGCVCLAVDDDGRRGEVATFFIDPGWKRKGIGRLLWNRLLETARNRRLEGLFLDADPFAVPFYEAMGFVTVGEVPSGSIPGRTIPHMQINL